MKAISLWQPWASAVAVGAKRIETRTWGTKYRGWLAIHASARRRKYELTHFHSMWNWCGALRPLGIGMASDLSLIDVLPFGAIVGVCELSDCRRTDEFTVFQLDRKRLPHGESNDSYSWTERDFGNFSIGRYGWVLRNARRLKDPVPFRGSLGLFDVPLDLAELWGSEKLIH